MELNPCNVPPDVLLERALANSTSLDFDGTPLVEVDKFELNIHKEVQ